MTLQSSQLADPGSGASSLTPFHVSEPKPEQEGGYFVSQPCERQQPEVLLGRAASHRSSVPLSAVPPTVATGNLQ